MVGDLNGNKDFSVIKPFAFWTQHVLPLVYGDEISYIETLDKVVKLLNELIKNNNKLPEYIQQIIEEYITGGPLEEVLRGILADFILNVKYPPTGITPAKGDGTANDYEAIQGCIDYVASKGGGVVYFPFGKYLTSKLTLKPNVSLMGFSKYCTSIVLTGGETDALLRGTVTECGIYNLELDANMSIQVNDVDVLTLVGSNIQLMNVILTDGHTLFNIEKNGGNIELTNVEFRYAVESMLRIGGTGSIIASNIKFGKLSTIKGIAAIISDSNDDVITGIISNDSLPLFAELDGNNNTLKGFVVSANISGTGVNNNYEFYGNSKNETYSGNVSETVGGSKSTHISGVSTWSVDDNSNESVDGNKSEIVTGISSVKYVGDRTVNAGNVSEILTGKKVENERTKEETVSENYDSVIGGNYNVNVTGNISETCNDRVAKSNNLFLDLINPLKYSKPYQLSETMKAVKFMGTDNNEYNLLAVDSDTKLSGLFTLSPSGDTSGVKDTTSIQVALDTYKCVMLEPGEFYINDTIKVKNGYTLMGCGKGSTVVNVVGDIEFMTGYNGVSVDHINVKDLKIVADTVSTKYCFNFLYDYVEPYLGCRYSAFMNVWVHNFYGGFNGSVFWCTTFIGCRFVALNTGVRLGNAVNAILFLACQFYLSDLATENTGAGVVMDSRGVTENYNISFINCDAEKFAIGYNIKTTVGATWFGCYWEKVSLCLQLDACPSACVKGGNMNVCDLIARLDNSYSAGIYKGLQSFEDITVQTDKSTDSGMIIPTSNIGKVYVRNVNIHNKGTGKCYYTAGEMSRTRTKAAGAKAVKQVVNVGQLRYSNDAKTFWFNEVGVNEAVKLQPCYLIVKENFTNTTAFNVIIELDGNTVASGTVSARQHNAGDSIQLNTSNLVMTEHNLFTIKPSSDGGVENNFDLIACAFIGEFYSPSTSEVPLITV